MRPARSLLGVLAVLAFTSVAHAAGAKGRELVIKRGAFATEGSLALEHATRRVLEEHVGVDASVGLSKPVVLTLAAGDRVVKVRQEHKRVPVLHRGASVVFRGDVARLLTTRLEETLPESVEPAITAAQASSAAAERTGIDAGPERVALAILPSPGRLVWVVAPPGIPGVPYQPVTFVDAETAEILVVYNAVRDLNAAQVYETNPVKSPALINVTLPVGAAETTLENASIKSLNCIDLKTVKTINVGVSLDVHVCDLLPTALADVNGDFPYTPAADTAPEDSFSEMSIFYHAHG